MSKLTGRKISCAYYDESAKTVTACSQLLKKHLRYLGELELKELSSIGQVTTPPFDLLVVDGRHVPEDHFFDWLKRLTKKMHSPNHIWTPGLVIANLSFKQASKLFDETVYSNWYFDIVRETLKITNLNTLEISKMVNLERAMLLSSRIDGHIVQGHIDGVGEIIDISTDKDNTEIFIRLEEENSKNCIFKGSIAINGISLTIADIKKNIIKIAIIPHTLNNTTLTYVKIGDLVNIETDMLSKYVEKIMSYKNV